MNRTALTDFCTFAREHVLSWDIDPMYPVLRKLYEIQGLDTETALWRTFTYVLWYDIGSAQRTWDRYPAAQEIHGSFRLPTGIERRGFRGNDRARIQVNAFVAVSLRRYGSLTAWVDARVKGRGPEQGWDQVKLGFQALPGNGPWAGYKWADLLAHVHGYPITAGDIGVGGGGETAGPIPGMVRVTGRDWRACARDIGLQRELLAETQRRGVPFTGLDQMETSLCDFNSLAKGHYYVGHDIDGQQASLSAVEAGPDLWAARRRALPEPYLGELHGWSGVRRELNGLYAEKGEIARAPWG